MSQLTKDELVKENEKLAELKKHAGFLDAQEYKLETCPVCRNKTMKIYKACAASFFCECPDCDVSGTGADISKILKQIEDDMWTNQSQ